MKTKDLLEDLETGDRTMEHLKEEPILQQQAFLGGFGGIGTAIGGLGSMLGQYQQLANQQFNSYTTANTNIQGGRLW